MSVSTETRTMLEQDFFEHHPEARRKAAPVQAEEPQPPNGDEPKPPEYSLTTSVSVPPPERKQ